MVGLLTGWFNRKSVGTGVAFSVLSTVMVFAAVNADGSSATNVHLDDGTVWVTNSAGQRVGRLNVAIDQIDFAVAASAGGDVIQEARTVLFSAGNGGVDRLDVLTGQPSGDNQIPIDSYQVMGGVGVVIVPDTGEIWVGRSDAIVAPDYPSEPDAILDVGSRVVVTEAVDDRLDLHGRPRGKVLIFGPSGWFELELDQALEPVRQPSDVGDTTPPVSVSLDAGENDDEPPPPIKTTQHQPLGVDWADINQVSAVGETPILLTVDGAILTPGSAPVNIPGDQPVVQQVGPAADEALVASTQGLFAYHLDDGGLRQIGTTAGGQPAAPVRVGVCVFGAWSGGEPVSLKACNGTVVRDMEPLANAVADAELIWRVNQRNVALNSPGDGGVWADHEGTLAYVGDWSDVEDQSIDSDQEDQATGESLRVTERICLPGGAEAPIAGDDQLGVRPRQSILDVLSNDDDLNCEPIAIVELVPEAGPWGQLTIIDNGQHLLYSPSDEVVQGALNGIEGFQFSYIVEDTSGNRSSAATVAVQARYRDSGNVAPALRPKGAESTREMVTVVEEGRTVSYDVLADWWDPDGDDLRLVRAVPDGRGEISTTPDGIVRFSAFGVSPGLVSVLVTMSDGVLETTETLEVTVKPSGAPIPPVAANDFITLVEGATGSVYPLANDSDPNENPLDLRPLWLPDEEGAFRTAIRGRAVEITALSAGTYRLDYEATDGIDAAPAAIRLVVVAPDGLNRGPVAVPDQVKLRADRVVNVDVLANDIDPDGDLLAVIDASASATDPELGTVRASIVDRRMVQLEVVPGPGGQPPTGPFFVTYTVDDGRQAERAADLDAADIQAESLRSIGAITVLVQPPSDDQPPIAVSDSAVVRSGDIVAVPVLRNDSDPDSDPVVLESIDPEQAASMEAAGEGVAWVEGRFVYFQGGLPGRRSILYTVSAGGVPATGELSIDVKELPDQVTNPNQPPSPPDLVLRAVRNGAVRLPIPLFGIDLDGDSVVVVDEFTGHQGAATGNRVFVDAEDPEAVVFEAGPTSASTDVFTYTVEDRYGERGTATVKVMVLDDGGWAPQAHDDVFRGRPGRTLSIPVLANDSSPSDRALEMAAEPFFDLDGQPTATPVNAETVALLDQTNKEDRGRIEILVPDDGATLTEHYRISDGRNPGDAFVRVTPDPEAPNLPPVANRDVVEFEEVAGQDVASVAVLDNDFDPDDAGASLALSIPAHQNGTADRGIVTVPLGDRPQIVLYRIGDVDGASTIGVVEVPGRQNHPPELSPEGRDVARRTIVADDEGSLTIRLDEIVTDPDGDAPLTLTAREVEVLGGLGGVRRLDNEVSGFVYSPPPNLQETTTVGIQFEVTDRPQFSDDERQEDFCNCLALLTVQVRIEASSPPRILAQGAVPVPQLDEQVQYDLSPLVVDDQGDALTFELDPSSYGGLEVTLAGSTMSLISRLAADTKIAVGTQIPIRFTASDGVFEPVEGTVIATMIATNKGQPAAGSFPPLDAERDEVTATPNLLTAASNPFPERPLTLVNATADGGATITCDVAGNCDFVSAQVGDFTVSYTLKDAVDQTASGTLAVRVKGKPRAPGVPSIAGLGDHQITLAWTPADMQGGAFVTYHVTEDVTGTTKQFTTTGGVFDGLTNGQAYRFTVAAENELGLGELSAPSTPGIPDRVPDQPTGLAITAYGDGALTLQWAPPTTAGDYTAIINYELSIGGQTIQVGGSQLTAVIGTGGLGTPLQNGVGYTFRARARNGAPTNNGWGAWAGPSPSELPSRHPDPPTGVAATNSGDGGQPRLTVTWNAPSFNGGRPIDNYQVCVVQVPSNCQLIESGLQATFVANRAQAWSFTVVAFNTDVNRSNSDPSAASSVVTAVGTPDAPTITNITSGDKQLIVTASSTNGSGCSSMSLEYSRNSGSSWQSSTTFTGLTNGTQNSIIARARLGTGCGTPGQTYVSAASGAANGTPYGPLQTPAITAEVSGDQVRWHWDTNRADDGRPGWSATLSSTTGGTGCNSQTLPTGLNQTGTTGWKTIGYSTNGGCQIRISATGVTAKTAQAAATTGQRPLTFAFSRGGTGANGSGTTPCAGCTWIRLSISGLAPGSYQVRNSWDPYNPTVSVGGNGILSIGDGWRFCGAGPTLIVNITVDGVNRSGSWQCT